MSSPTRPRPPSEPRARLFLPAPEIVEWLRQVILEEGSELENADHAHLRDAHLVAVWTWQQNRRKMREVTATAEIPRPMGGGWTRSRHQELIQEWAGLAHYEPIPDFLLTFYAPHCARLDDASWCALVEHELYHCAQALDEYGAPRFTRQGRPVFAIKGHDVEEFVGVVRRYGSGATSGQTGELVRAARHEPEVARAAVSAACGLCLRRAA